MPEQPQHTIAEAADADLVDQRQPVTESGDEEEPVEVPVELPIDAPEGDVLEQSLPVGMDDDEEPRAT